MGLTENIVRRRVIDGTCMMAYIAFPAATIDITAGAALDVSIG